jgi:hypothetical protein
MMLFQKTIPGLALMTSLFVAGCAAETDTSDVPHSSGIVEAKEVPGEFKLVARFSPLGGRWLGWETTVGAYGKVAQTTWTVPRGIVKPAKQARLTKDELDLLWSKIKEAHFFELKKEYSSDAIDQDILDLKITRKNETHEVSVYRDRNITKKDDRSEVKRFLGVWSEVIRFVPSPNPDQKADL